MKISEIKRLLNAELLTKNADIERDVHSACGSDMMSDVLAFVKEQGMLLTGLINCQVIRTADMMDMVWRGLRAGEETYCGNDRACGRM